MMKIWTYMYVKDGKVTKIENWRFNDHVNASYVASKDLITTYDYGVLVFIGAVISEEKPGIIYYYNDVNEFINTSASCRVLYYPVP